MAKKIFILALIASLFIFVSICSAKEVSFTQEDRERLIRLEEGQKHIQEQIRTTNQRIDDLRDLIYVVIGGMIALVGFVIWDRRSALAPAIRKNRELEERQERVEKALRELARKNPDVAEVLKNTGLL